MKKAQIKKSVSALAMAAVIAVSLFGYGCGAKSASTSSDAGVSGDFTGTAKGFGGDVSVTLTLTDGVITGCILSVGRILGESAALLFTAGFAHALNGFFDGLSSAGATLTVALYVYAKEQGQFDVAFAIAAILMLLTLLINGAAMLVERYFRRKRSL